MSTFVKTFFLFFLTSILSPLNAAEVQLAWDTDGSSAVSGYRLFIGTASHEYFAQFELGNVDHHTVQNLREGQTYYFNLQAVGSDGVSVSEFAGEVIHHIPLPPNAEFVANTLSGVAPLVVTFSDQSSGLIESRQWNFGNGITSSAAIASLSYDRPGIYTVTLTVEGPGGRSIRTRTDYIHVYDAPNDPEVNDENDPNDDDGTTESFPIEMMTIDIDERWQWFAFDELFVDPIVIAGTPLEVGTVPGIVRVRHITSEGFEIRLQPWDYLGNTEHTTPISVVAIEAGHHVLADGTRLEAGLVASAPHAAIQAYSFREPFDQAPVIVSTVVSEQETDALVSRIRRVNSDGFQMSIQEQEASPNFHVSETIAYLAWEPSNGIVGDWRYRVQSTAREVDHQAYPIVLDTPLTDTPAVFGDIQENDGFDPASLVWTPFDDWELSFRIREEQSRDRETRHNAQVIGYMIFDPLY